MGFNKEKLALIFRNEIKKLEGVVLLENLELKDKKGKLVKIPFLIIHSSGFHAFEVNDFTKMNEVKDAIEIVLKSDILCFGYICNTDKRPDNLFRPVPYVKTEEDIIKSIKNIDNLNQYYLDDNDIRIATLSLGQYSANDEEMLNITKNHKEKPKISYRNRKN